MQKASHTILSVVDKIQNGIDDREFSYGIVLDLSEAFDTINHEILLNKIDCYEIRGTERNWLSSYLPNRQHFHYKWHNIIIYKH